MTDVDRATYGSTSTPGDTRADLETLRKDFDRLRSNLAQDARTLREDVRAFQESSMEAMRHRIEEQPVSSLLMTLGTGVLMGLLFGRTLLSGSSTSRSSGYSSFPSRTTRAAWGARGTAVTGTTDDDYDLISALYHAIEGAWKYEQYAIDARQQGDRELEEFFSTAQQHHRELADHAKRLLQQRLAHRH